MRMDNKEFVTNFIFRVIITIGVVGSIRYICDALRHYYFSLEALSEGQYICYLIIDAITPIVMILALYFMGNWVLRLFKDIKKISEVIK
jgi:uncharacterized membrane protein